MSRDAARRYLIAYDIVDDRRRTRIAHKLSSYGDRVQFSVFVIDTTPAKILRLRATLARMMSANEDSILLCDLGLLSADPARRLEILGQPRPALDRRAFIF